MHRLRLRLFLVEAVPIDEVRTCGERSYADLANIDTLPTPRKTGINDIERSGVEDLVHCGRLYSHGQYRCLRNSSHGKSGPRLLVQSLMFFSQINRTFSGVIA